MPSFITSDNVKINYEKAGTGSRTLVFLHGISCSSAYFEKQLSGLSDEFTVIVPDLRGCGKSDTPEDGYTIAGLAKDVKELIEAEGAKDVILCGWSLGVTILYEYLQQFGQDDFTGIVIVDQAPREYGTFDAFDYKDAMEMLYMVMADWDNFVPVFASLFFGDNEDEEKLTWVQEQIRSCDRTVLFKMILSCFMQDYRRFLKEIRLPALIVDGVASKMYKTEDSVYTHSQIKNSKLVCLEGCGHALHLEVPDKFNEVVRDFAKNL